MAAGCTVVNPLDRYQSGGTEDGGPSVPGSESGLDGSIDAVHDAAGDDRVDADPGPGWTLYSYSLLSKTWAAPVLLRDAWTGSNAPPPRGIASAVQLVDEDRLLVFADNGNYYLRAAGVWRTPVPVAQAWAPMTFVPKGAYHVPFAFIKTVNAGAPNVEGLTFADNPVYFLFNYHPNDTIVFDRTGTTSDEDGGPKQRTGHIAWNFEVLDLGNADPNLRYQLYSLYDDGFVYLLRADGVFVGWPIAESPFWKGKTGAAPTTGLTAAYVDQAKGTAYFIGP